MPGRVPGPTCGTTAPRIDGGTNCRTTTPRPGPVAGARDAASQPRATLRFAALWQGYPGEPPYKDEKGEVPAGYENQCAIKVSVALLAAGASLRGFTGATVTVGQQRLAIRAQELGLWLQRSPAAAGLVAPQDITGSGWQASTRGDTGILYFQDYWLRDGEKSPSGDHIDLWNGSRLTASGLAGALTTGLRWLGVNSGPGFSDLGKAKRILFWRVP